MTILTLQRRLREAGRIRIGAQVTSTNGKSRPTKLEAFRLTSADKTAIWAAASLYGGEPHRWEGAPVDGDVWEVFTSSATIPVVVPPASAAMSQFFEAWSGGGCIRRCDGERELMTESPCICATENETICKPTTRLNVILRDLPGLGVWRIESHGWYAAVELAGTVEVCIAAATRGQLLPAVLRLEQRQVKRPGETVKKFAVPVLDIALTPSALGLVVGQAAIAAPEPQPAIPANGQTWQPIDQPPVVPLGAGDVQSAIKAPSTAGPKKRKNSPPDLPPTGLKPRGRPASMPTEPDEPEHAMSGPAMIGMLMGQHGVTTRADKQAAVANIIGRVVESTKELTAAETREVIAFLSSLDPEAPFPTFEPPSRVDPEPSTLNLSSTVIETTAT